MLYYHHMKLNSDLVRIGYTVFPANRVALVTWDVDKLERRQATVYLNMPNGSASFYLTGEDADTLGALLVAKVPEATSL
jgi:hypothetical protein